MKKLELFTLLFVLATSSAFAGLGTVSVTGSATQVIPGRAARTSLVLQNNDTNNIWVKWDSSTNAVTTTNGFKLQPGMAISLSATPAFNSARNAITAIATGTATLTYQEDDAR